MANSVKPAPFWWPDTRSLISIMLVAAVIGLPLLLRQWGGEIPENGSLRDAIKTIETLATIAVGYWLGSSAGSARKDDQIQEMALEASKIPAANASTTTTTVVTPTTTTTTSPVNGSDDVKAWNEAVAANTRVAFEGYLTKYPTGVRAPDAKARIAALP